MEKCKEHPWYTGKRRSRKGCETCARIYAEAHATREVAPSADVAPAPQG